MMVQGMQLDKGGLLVLEGRKEGGREGGRERGKKDL